MTSLKRDDGSRVTLGKMLSSGGEGKIYLIDEDKQLVAKIYQAAKPESAAKLQMMLAQPPTSYIRDKGHISIVWPEPKGRLFDAQNKCVGFLMPYVDLSHSYLLFKLYNPQDRQKTLPGFTWRYLLRTARNITSIVNALHQSNYTIGDLNESNIFVNRSAQITLIDCDSMQVPQGTGRFFRCPVGKPEYTPPELQGCNFSQVDRNANHDNFGLAVVIFLLLMEGRHPFAGILQGNAAPLTVAEHIQAGNCSYTGSRNVTQPRLALPFTILPPDVQTLMKRCFVDGHDDPDARPSAYEWSQVLREAERQLSACKVNGQHQYSNHLKSCPWCERIRLGMPDPFPRQNLQSPLKSVRPAPSLPGISTGHTGTGQLTQVLSPQLTQVIPSPTTPVPSSQRTTPTKPPTAVPSPQRTMRRPPSPPPKSTNISRRVFLGTVAGLALAGAGGWWAYTHGLLGESATVYLTYTGHKNSVQAVSWAFDGDSIASGSVDKTVQVWGVSNGKSIFTFSGQTKGVRTVSWSPDGKRIASAGDDKLVRIWDATTGKHTISYHGHNGTVYSLAWSPDGKLLASASGDKTVQVWHASTGRHVFTYRGHAKNAHGYVFSVTWSPDGQRIASGAGDGTVQVWNAISGSHILLYKGHTSGVSAVAWSPDGTRIASGSSDKTVRVWNAITAVPILTYSGHFSPVTTVAWSPNSQSIASGEMALPATPSTTSTSSTVQVWDVREGGNAFIYHGHTQGVNAVAWSPDGSRIASAAGDKTVQVWQAV